MAAKNDVNSEEYWDKRFQEDWQSNQGDEQSIFFASLALEMFPVWFKDYFVENKLDFCDWGCADGDGTHVIAQSFKQNKFTGIDFADTAIEKAKKRFKDAEFTAIDLLTQRYDKKHDVVFSSNVFEHFHNPWEVFEKVSQSADKFFIMMMPFNEPADKRIPEHFASFSFNNIPLKIGEWSLAHFSVKNTETLEKTYWAGEQVMLIFVKQDLLPILRLQFSDITIYTKELEEKKRILVELNQKLSAKDEQIHKQQEQIKRDWELLSSKRWMLADRMGQGFNKILPQGTPQRYVIKQGIRVLRGVKGLPKTTQWLNFRLDLIRLARRHQSVIVHSGMPWDNIMRQRPHHIAEGLSALGHLFVYVDPVATEPRKISDNLIIVGDYRCINALSLTKGTTKLYFLSPAGFPTSYEELAEIKKKGFEIIYEYIDELDEEISGDLTKQREVFDRLNELDPVLLLASAQKLYAQLNERFPENKLLLNENAVDNKHFAPRKQLEKQIPPDLEPILAYKKPIIGYYGALAKWIDYELIDELARERPDHHIVLIGIDYGGGLQHLRERDNVHYIGPKNYADLPRYSYWFDCAIIPFIEGEIAKSTSPVKLFEYMAMGLPTVCTRDLRECSGYEGVLMSKDHEAFIKNIDKAIALKRSGKAQKKLLGYARDNTWRARAKAISDRLEELS